MSFTKYFIVHWLAFSGILYRYYFRGYFCFLLGLSLFVNLLTSLKKCSLNPSLWEHTYKNICVWAAYLTSLVPPDWDKYYDLAYSKFIVVKANSKQAKHYGAEHKAREFLQTTKMHSYILQCVFYHNAYVIWSMLYGIYMATKFLIFCNPYFFVVPQCSATISSG